MVELTVTGDGSLSGTLPCGHDASDLSVGWAYRIQCSACWSAYVQSTHPARVSKSGAAVARGAFHFAAAPPTLTHETSKDGQ